MVRSGVRENRRKLERLISASMVLMMKILIKLTAFEQVRSTRDLNKLKICHPDKVALPILSHLHLSMTVMMTILMARDNSASHSPNKEELIAIWLYQAHPASKDRFPRLIQ